MQAVELLVAVVSGGVGFVLADGIDRFLATYDPSATGEKPKDKFTSDGAGTLANTLNVASRPSLIRVAAGIGTAAVPAVASMYVDNPFMKSGLEGLAIGAGVSVFKTFWNNFLMPMLIGKDKTSTGDLQKSFIARLYPAEVAAHINLEQKQTSASGVAFGALSGGDVGPFALAAESPYPDAGQALRRATGVQDAAYPSAQNVWGTGGPGSDYPTAAQAMGTGAPAGHGNPGQPGLSAWEPGPPPTHGPGPQPVGSDPQCGCISESNPFLGFIGDQPTEEPLFNTGT